MSRPPAPLDVACPHCDAAVGDDCVKPNHEETDPHARRVKASEKAKRDREQGAAAPAAVADAGKEWATLYRACRLELEQRGDWTKLADKQLSAMVLNLARAETVGEAASMTAVVTGSTGQQAAHPLWRVGISLENTALAQAKALKLTPDTRGTSAVPDDSDLGADDSEDEDGGFGALDRVAEQRQKRDARRSG